MTTYYLDKSSKLRHSDGVWLVCLQTAQPVIKNGLSTTTSITPEEQNIPQRRLSKSHSKFLWLQFNSSMADLKKFESLDNVKFKNLIHTSLIYRPIYYLNEQETEQPF